MRGLAAEGAEIDEADASFNEDEADQEPISGCKDLELLRGGGLFFRNAFVLVRRADRWLRRYTDALAKALPKFSKGSGLVLETQKVDKRKKFWKGSPTAMRCLSSAISTTSRLTVRVVHSRVSWCSGLCKSRAASAFHLRRNRHC